MICLANKERVRRALDLVEPALAAYVEGMFKRLFGEAAHGHARRYFAEKKREADAPIRDWDLPLLLLVIKRSWEDLPWDRVEVRLVCDVLVVRNRVNHQRVDLSDGDTETALRLIDHLHRFISPPPGPKLLELFNKQLEEERVEPFWTEVLSRVWPADWRGTYYLIGEGAELNLGAYSWARPGHPGRYEGVALYVLPMDRPYRKGGPSPAEALAAEMLASMKYPNSAVFLGVDEGSVPSLRDKICRLRSWEEVRRNAQDLQPHEEEGGQASLEQAEREVLKELRESYRWLLVPTQANPQDPVEWKTIQLESSQNPVERASKELRRLGEVVWTMHARHLAEVLDRVPLWKARRHVKIDELALEFARHLHPPRLKDWTVLDKAIAEALTDREWGYFAYASHHDDFRGYAGVYFRGSGEKPTAGLLKHRIGFLVKPQVLAPVLLGNQ